MKAKSIQDSILQSILDNEENQSPTTNPHFSQSSPNHPIHHKPARRQKKPLSSSLINIQDDLFQMKSILAKQPHPEHKSSTSPSISPSTKIHKAPAHKKIKTQHNPDYPPSSTYYTRRCSINSPSPSPCPGLYSKAMQSQQAQQHRIQKNQQQQAKQQLQECTHQPAINKTSQQIMSQVDRQLLYEKNKRKKQDSIKRIQQDQENREMIECRFTPNLNAKGTGKGKGKDGYMGRSVQVEMFEVEDCSDGDGSRASCKPRAERNSISIFDHLYQDSKSRQLKSKKLQQTYMKQCQKTPKIDPISKQITKHTVFEQRLEIYQKRRLEKQLQSHPTPSRTPKTNKSTHPRHPSLSIHQHLYLQSKHLQSPACPSPLPQQTAPLPNKKSMEFYESRKAMVFEQLFRILDGDQDDYVSIGNICLEALPHQLLRILYPLIQELEVMEVELQEPEFVQALTNLFKTLSVHEKDIVLGFVGGCPKQDKSNPSTKPSINYRSKMITSCNQRSQMSIYEYCSIRQAQKQKHLETQRIEKSKKQLEECTFQPKVIIRCRY